jgi:hypothetical protein
MPIDSMLSCDLIGAWLQAERAKAESKTNNAVFFIMSKGFTWLVQQK